MSERLRLIAAVCAGLMNAALVYAISDAINAPRLWPGTIFAFAAGTMTALIFSRPRRGGR